MGGACVMACMRQSEDHIGDSVLSLVGRSWSLNSAHHQVYMAAAFTPSHAISYCFMSVHCILMCATKPCSKTSFNTKDKGAGEMARIKDACHVNMAM